MKYYDIMSIVNQISDRSGFDRHKKWSQLKWRHKKRTKSHTTIIILV
jgi:hypothetical protein